MELKKTSFYVSSEILNSMLFHNNSIDIYSPLNLFTPYSFPKLRFVLIKETYNNGIPSLFTDFNEGYFIYLRPVSNTLISLELNINEEDYFKWLREYTTNYSTYLINHNAIKKYLLDNAQQASF